MAGIGVLIADDKEFMRQALAKVLQGYKNIQILGMAVDGEDAVRQAAKLRPQVAILDIRMPKLDGIQVCHRIIAQNPGTGIVIVSAFDDTEYIVALLKNGPEGKAYLLKHSIDNVEELSRAIEAVAAGLTVLDPHIANKLAEKCSISHLTDQEQWVLALLAEGYSDFGIVRTIHIELDELEAVINALSQKMDMFLGGADIKQRNINAVLALVDPNNELRQTWIAGSGE